MDSEHRHELEENALANWLGAKIEAVKPHLPVIVVGTLALVVGIIALSGWRASASEAKAERWRDFAVALEQGQPDLLDLKAAAEANPGEPVAEWADVTWADGKLFQASQLYFRNRKEADAAADEAVAVYERLVASSDDDVAERASFQLGRAYELQGKLDEAVKQYARVTGAFAMLAKSRGDELQTNAVKRSYEWITATESSEAAGSVASPGESLDDLNPDEIELPEIDTADADATLDDLLEGVDVSDEPAMDTSEEASGQEASGDESTADESTADEDAAGEGSSDEAMDDSEAPAEAPAEETQVEDEAAVEEPVTQE